MPFPAEAVTVARRWRLILVVACAIVPFLFRQVVADTPPGPSRDGGEQLFAQKVWPLLVEKCLACHGDKPDDIKGGLDLRSRATAVRGGDSGEPAWMAGKPDRSPLFIAVTRRDAALVMPPKENDKLSAEQVESIRRWIMAGAAWPAAERLKELGDPSINAADGVIVHTSGGRTPEWTNRRYKPENLWAYQPIRAPDVPSDVIDPARIANPLDAFIQSKLAARDVSKLAAPADRRTLIRRLTFDLTGLPPSPDEVEAFVNDNAPDAYSRLSRRLLDSRHYGEQQARHWLDVVRYADTSGFSNDFERPNAWRYRDYVIRSFNADKPFDRFVLEQLAGDELEPDQPEMHIAVGFLRMGPWEHTGMTVAAVTRQQFLDDVTHHVGVTLLAQGLRCAACHDHKFDPVPTQDYYRIQSVFASTQFAERDVAFLPAENISGVAAAKDMVDRRLNEIKSAQAALKKKGDDAIAMFLAARGVKSLEDLPPAERPKKDYLGHTFGLTKTDLTLRKVHQKAEAYIERELRRFEPLAFSVYSGPPNQYTSIKAVNPLPKQRAGEVPAIHILAGGSLESPTDPVTPGVLSAMSTLASAARSPPLSPLGRGAGGEGSRPTTDSPSKPAPPLTPNPSPLRGERNTDRVSAATEIPNSTTGRRLAFARWVTSRDNTLTARVIVNRIWQQHFGRGLVATPNNFGSMGKKPTHPDLLDWLATWFVDHGWSVKRLHELIVNSATYQQAGDHPQRERLLEIDSANDLLAYFPPRRLAAEELRDALLAVTNELNREAGGPGVFPELNWEVAHQPRHIMGSVAPAYQPSRTPTERNRRTIYAFRYRTLPDPLLEVFNRPGSETSCERRDETTVAPQALALFHSDFLNQRATAFAVALERQAPTLDRRIDLAFRSVFSREATRDEIGTCSLHVAKMLDFHRGQPPQRTPLPQRVSRSMVEELTGETVSWEEELPGMSDYIRDQMPWDVAAETRALAELCLVLLNANEFLYVR